MRRFSQRNSLVTLNEINITPLLDLGVEMTLAKGGAERGKIEPRDFRRVEITRGGDYLLDGRPMRLPQIEDALVRAFQSNPKSVVYIRADGDGPNKFVYAVIDMCQRRGITRFSLATEPPK